MPWASPGELPVAGLFAEAVSSAVVILVGFTTLFGGAAHYGAVLARRSKGAVEWFTGVGFFIGLGAGIVILLLKAIS